MDDLYVKDSDGSYVPIALEVASSRDLADKLIIITVGDDNEPASPETLEYVRERFVKSKIIIEAMKRSKDANLLILPHIIKVELISKRDMAEKTVCIRLDTDDEIQNFPEIKKQLKNTIRKDVVILPVPLSLSEYKEFKAIKERVRIRKHRSGGGLNIGKK